MVTFSPGILYGGLISVIAVGPKSLQRYRYIRLCPGYGLDSVETVPPSVATVRAYPAASLAGIMSYYAIIAVGLPMRLMRGQIVGIWLRAMALSTERGGSMASLDEAGRYKGYVTLAVAVEPKSGAIADMLELRQALVILFGLIACNQSKDQVETQVDLALRKAGY